MRTFLWYRPSIQLSDEIYPYHICAVFRSEIEKQKEQLREYEEWREWRGGAERTGRK